MENNQESTLRKWGVPAAKVGTLITVGALMEDYLRSNGSSFAAYVKDGVRFAANNGGPIIGDLLDAAGKYAVNYMDKNPAASVLIGTALVGTMIAAGKKGYIRNPLGRD